MLRENDGWGATGVGEAAGLPTGALGANFRRFRKADTAKPTTATSILHRGRLEVGDVNERRDTTVLLTAGEGWGMLARVLRQVDGLRKSIFIALVGAGFGFFASDVAAGESLPTLADGSGEMSDLAQRRVKVKPQRPDRGIPSGLVFAYGHPFRPPYKVEVVGSKILVNGVQVIPAGQSEPTPPKTPVDPNSVFRLVEDIQNMAREGQSSDSILARAQKHPEIKSAKLHGSNSIELLLAGGVPLVVALPSKGSRRISEREAASRSSDALKARAGQIVNALKAGKCVIFVDGGISTKANPARFSRSVLEILDNKALATQEKMVRLQGVANESMGFDLLANYESEEWNFLRE